MSYSLGLDLGTTNSAAAIADDTGVRMLSIGHDGPIVTSVVHLDRTGAITIGRAAERRAVTDPAGVAREFKRRFGDSTPFLLHGTPVAANDLMLEVALHLVARATELQGAAPDRLAVCHPANWGDFKISLLSDTLANADLPPHRLVTEPEAAAIHYASHERVPEGTTVAVYDLGGGTFDVAIMSKTAQGWRSIGRPGGIERLGGIDFDTAVFQHVLDTIDLDPDRFDENDAATRAGMLRIRTDCIEAKHTLSSDTSATIAVLLPGISEQVRITRTEFESMIRPAVTRSLDAFDTALASAELDYHQIDRILMVGGSSRIPLVAAQLASHTGRPLATDAHPKDACALGAALLLTTTPPEPKLGPTVTPAPQSAASVPAPAPVEPPPPATTPPHDASIGTSLGGLFQDLPHISEGRPEFMEERRNHSIPPATDRPAARQPITTPTSTTRTVTPRAAITPGAPVIPTGHRSADGSRRRRRVGPALGGLLLALGLGGAAALALGIIDRNTFTDNGADTSVPVDERAGTELPGSSTGDNGADPMTTTVFTNVTGCPDDRISDPAVSYRITEIPTDDPDGGANARSGPSLADPPVTVLASLSPIEVTHTDCEIDGDGRVWWGIERQGVLLWVAASLIEPQG